MIDKIAIPNLNFDETITVGKFILYLDKHNYLNYYTAQGLQKKEWIDIPGKKKLKLFNNNSGDGFFCIADSSLYKADISASGKLSFRKMLANLKYPADISVLIEKDSNTFITGTKSHGLFIYKKNLFKISEPLPNNQSNAFFIQHILPDNQTIFTSYGHSFRNGLHYEGQIPGFEGNFFGIFRDSKGWFWYAIPGQMLRTHKIGATADTVKNFKGRFIEILFEDTEGRIWMDSESEFGYFKDNQYTEVKINDLIGRRVNCMKQHANGKYYIGTDLGLFVLDDINQANAKEIPQFKPARIRDIQLETDGTAWIFTYGSGFYLLAKDGITSFSGNNEKLNFIHTMMEDANGNCWLPSDNGLFVTTKKSLIEFSKNKVSTPFFYKFTMKDGLRTNEFNDGSETSILRLPNGDFSITSMDGLVRFSPLQMSFSFSASPILIDQILLDSNDVEEKDFSNVSASTKNIHFSILTSYWGNKENNVLEYVVKSKSATIENSLWLHVDESGDLNVFAPGHGNYELMIRKRIGFGANDYLYKTVQFYVQPKWYQTKAFYTIVLLAFILMMMGILSLRKNYYRKANEALQQKINAATAELQEMNITLEKKVEERTLEIQKSEIKSRTLVERSQVGVYIIQENKFIYVNPRFEELTGYTSHQAVGMNPLLLFDEPEQRIVAEKIRQRMSGEVERDHYEIAGRKKDGTQCQWELLCSKTIYDGKQTLLGTMLDITERTNMQKELKEAETKFRDLVEKSMVGVYITTGKKLVYANPRYAEMFGYRQDELIGMNAVPITVYEDDKELVEKNIQARMEGKVESVHYEFRAVKKDGSIMYAEAFGRITQFEGKPAIIGTMIDITEKKLAAEQLIKEKNLSQSIINNLPGLFYIFDRSGKYLLWNNNLETVTGYNAAEISEMQAGTFTTQQSSEVVIKTFEKVYTEGYAEAEATLLTKDGKELFYYFNGMPINYNDRQCILGIAIDISERKKAQQEREFAIDALQKSEANLNTILLNTDTVYILLDIELKVIAYNQRAYDYVKKLYRGSLAINADFSQYLAQSRRKPFQEEAAEVINGNQDSYEKKYVHPNGEINWYYVRKFPVFHSSQNPLGIILVVSDITEKKLLEQEILEQKVQEQKKVIRAILTGEEKERNKIGQELHDNINQILAGTKLYLSVIEQEKSGDQHIKHSMQLLDSAINEIRELSKNKVTPPKSNSLPEMLQMLVDNFYIATKIKTNFSYLHADQFINEDLKLNIYRIVQEQLNNIVKHAEAKHVSIEVNVGEEDIYLLITDDGKGFDVESKRTGIGIANMTNRVESFNGSIIIESSTGNGCSVEINLPV